MGFIDNLGQSLGLLVGTIKVTIGGVFGIYLILIYLRWKEYQMFRYTLKGLRKDIRFVAREQGIKFPDVISEEKDTLRHRIGKWWIYKKRSKKKDAKDE